MEKKVLTEILRIKELIGGKTLLNEAGPKTAVNIIRFLSKFFKNETDDVVKKIVNASDNNIVAKLKTGNLDADEAALVIKNAGGIDKLYYNTVKETFNQTNYKDFFRNIQNWSKDITPERLIKYKVLVDKSVDKLLPNAPSGFKNQFKLFLNNNFDEALRIKNTPEIKPPKIKKPRKPKEEPIAKEEPKITTPTSEFSPDSAIKKFMTGPEGVTQAKISAAVDEDFVSLAKRWDIKPARVEEVKKQILANVKASITDESEKTFDNMMKIFNSLKDNPIEQTKFYDKMISEFNASFVEQITRRAEKNLWILKYAPDFVKKFTLENPIGKLMFGFHRYKGVDHPWSVLTVMAHMWASSFIIGVIDSTLQAATKTKNGKKEYTSGSVKTIGTLITGTDEEKDEIMTQFYAGHLVPIVNVVLQSFNAAIHFVQFAASYAGLEKDISDNPDDDEKTRKEKAMQRGLEIFKASLEKVNITRRESNPPLPPILDKYIDNITVNEDSDGLILTDNGTVYKIHSPLLGGKSYIVEAGKRYMFTNDMFTE